MKKKQNIPNKNIHSNNSSGKPLPDNYNTYRKQSPCRKNYRVRSLDRRKSQNFYKRSIIEQTVKITNTGIITQDQT